MYVLIFSSQRGRKSDSTDLVLSRDRRPLGPVVDTIPAVGRRTPGKHGVADLWYRDDGSPTKLAEPGSSKKRPRGQGSRWRAWYIDSDGRERTKRFATQGPAEAWVTTQVAALANGTYIDPKHRKTTLRSFYREWSEHQLWEANTRRAMDLAVNGATFADMPLSELRSSHVQAWVKSMQDKGLAPGTIKTRFTNVRGVLRAAVRDRVLSADVGQGVKLPRQRKAAAAMVIPSAQEVGKVLGSADERFAALIALAAFAGMRAGEVAALKVSDVDFLKREVHVRRQAQRVKGMVEYRPPKYGSERTVYAPEGLINMLSEHVRVFRPGEDPDRWLFPGDGEDSLYPAQVYYRWDCARDMASVEFRLHDLRHFYASGLIAAGCDPVTVQRAMGHHSAAFTLSTYSHLWPDAADRTREAAAGLFKQVGGSAYVVRTIGT
jgi:integrase